MSGGLFALFTRALRRLRAAQADRLEQMTTLQVPPFACVFPFTLGGAAAGE